MDKLPCSTSILMSVNFDGLKEVIDFFHKNINTLNEKINDLYTKLKDFDDIKNQVNENKTQTESTIRLLNELEEKMNNYSTNIMNNTEKIKTNEGNINKLTDDVEKLQILNNNNISDSSNNNGKNEIFNKLFDKYEKLKEGILQDNNNNKDNINKLNKKFDELEQKMNSINNNISEININYEDKEKDLKNNNIDYIHRQNNYEGKNEINSESDNNKNYDLLSKRIDILEQNVNKLYSKEATDDYINNDKENNNNNFFELKKILDKKINEFNDKMIKIEEDIKNIKLNTNIGNNNPNMNINNPLTGTEEAMIAKKLDANDNDNLIKDNENNINLLKKNIAEIVSQINDLNNKLSQDESLKKSEFNKYSQKLDVQLKDYNDKINKILQNENSRNKLIEDLKRNVDISSYKQKDDNANIEEKKAFDNKYATIDMLKLSETRNREMIIKYLSNIDISSNPTVLEINKNIEDSKNLVKELGLKIEEIIVNNNKNNENNSNLIEDIKKEVKNNMKKIENEIDRISSLQEEIDFFRVFLLGQEEDLKYKSMSQEEKKNELLIGTSIKEEMNIHGNYLKKLSEGINKVNSRINNLNKETLTLIKKDLKAESNNIFDDFKFGLKESISRIETQLRDKVDKLGLDQFWNKINEQLLSEMKEKIDKKEMNKNNQYLKRKIDNLESKISRTLVDTLIDLQMDEAPLVVKRNFREINEKKCASCGQNLPNINSGIMNNSSDFSNIGINQHKIFKQKNIGDKDKLPDIKQTLPK